jgi:hypothetical protein
MYISLVVCAVLTMEHGGQGCGRRFVARFRVTTWWQTGGMESLDDAQTSMPGAKQGRQVVRDQATSGKVLDGGRRSGESRWWVGRGTDSAGENSTAFIHESGSRRAAEACQSVAQAHQANHGSASRARDTEADKGPPQPPAAPGGASGDVERIRGLEAAGARLGDKCSATCGSVATSLGSNKQDSAAPRRKLWQEV